MKVHMMSELFMLRLQSLQLQEIFGTGTGTTGSE